jgi:heptosyltransferase-2
MYRRFLVIQTAFTGDAILASAVLEKLHLHFPEAHIDILVRKGNESLFANHPFLHAVLVWNKQQHKFRHLLKMLLTIRRSRYDCVINLHRFATSGLLTAFSGAKETSGFDKNPISFLFTRKIKHVIGDGRHETERNQTLIAHFTDDKAALPKLYPSVEDRQLIRRYQEQKYICIAPGSVWFTKTWPEEKWLQFIHLFYRRYPEVRVYLLGAPSEKPVCDRIISAAPNSVAHSLCGTISLLQSAALMQGATMNYVNDSAPMHLASAMNAPVTAVYCSTLPNFGFGPLSDQSHVVETRQSLECRPCGLHGHRQCPQGHFACANTIEEESLLTIS